MSSSPGHSTVHPPPPSGAGSLPPAPSGIAPAWHTALVLIAILALSWVGAHFDLRSLFGMHARVPNYLFVIVFEWATVAFIAWGLNRRGLHLTDLVAGKWARTREVFRDLGIGIAFMLVCGGAVQAFSAWFKIVTPQNMLDMLPQSVLELIVWVPLSLTAGFCEEVIFRGYLQRQFSALTRSRLGGILFQAVVFGIGHGYQGWKLMSLIALYGTCFGCLAEWRRSLRPGMIAHALQDTLGGLAARFLPH